MSSSLSLARNLTAAQKELCIKTSLSWGLNPLKREIHFVAYQGQEPKIVVGYDVYIKRAERTHNLDGWNVVVEGRTPDMKAVITIHRKDWSHPFVHEVYFEEVSQASGVWKKMPRFMLKKVAIGQGFRLCFPEEFGGMPYMAEEVGLDEVVNNSYVERSDGQQTNVNTGEIVEHRQKEVQAPDTSVPCGYPDCDGRCKEAWIASCLERFGAPLCQEHGKLASDGNLDQFLASISATDAVREIFPEATEVNEDVGADEVIAEMEGR
jgi:phage recombination protein Bet